ncbi:hypothetical protein [Kosmotoga pacifica]|uniref:Uncharacterized protein n=1 Tax=Kosmotoga pacifica TaxID=1330330 RepID=A0A0G2Z4W4_9BACT|nr:hypothetical protein [Kosmotoga pacifica]AKI96592.1 hypothetical protein IX53_00760 [Kosmotoga pacifica]
MRKLIFLLLLLLIVGGCLRIPEYVSNLEWSREGLSWQSEKVLASWKVELLQNNKIIASVETTETHVSWSIEPGIYVLFIDGWNNEPDGNWQYRNYYQGIIVVK